MRTTPSIPLVLAAVLSLLCGSAFLAYAEEAPSDVTPARFDRIRVVEFDTDIEPVLAAYVKRQLQYAKDTGAGCVVLRINSPGGTVHDSVKIGDLVLAEDDLYIVAWIPETAYSGAAIVALACDEMVMGRDAHVGDAQPILQSAEGPKPVGEKYETVLRAKMRNYATRNGYEPALAESMVSERMEVLRVRDPAGNLHYVNGEDFRAMDDDAEIFGVTKADLTQVGVPVIRQKELLTFTADEADRFGFLKRRFDGGRSAFPKDEEEFLGQLKAEGAQVDFVEMSFSERASRVLLTVAGILAAVVAIAAMLSLWQGFGTITIVGIVALVLAILITSTADMLHGFPIILIGVGLLLLAAEVFLIPGFGVAGLLGMLVLGAGFLFLAAGATIDDTGRITTDLFVRFGLQFVVTVLLGLAAVFALSRYLPGFGPTKKLMLTAPDSGPTQATPVVTAPVVKGQRGVATSTLRPAGSAEFEGRLVDVVADGDFVNAGVAVEVTLVEGNRVTVRPLETPADEEAV